MCVLDPRGFLGVGLSCGDWFCLSYAWDRKRELEEDPVCLVVTM